MELTLEAERKNGLQCPPLLSGFCNLILRNIAAGDYQDGSHGRLLIYNMYISNAPPYGHKKTRADASL